MKTQTSISFFSILETLMRVLLGLTLVVKGVDFITHTDRVYGMLANSRFEFASFIIVHYAVMVHLAGGILIALGLLTRLSSWFQLPVLFGAVFFVNAGSGFFSYGFQLEVSILVLLALIYFSIKGSSSYSLDAALRSRSERP